MKRNEASSLPFLDRLEQILVYRRGEQRAPHKPLYLLFCIAGIQHGLPRLQSFKVVKHTLAGELRRFGLRTKTLHPEYPFWRLQNDRLAVVETDFVLQYRKSNDDPTVSSLLRSNAKGGLLEGDHVLLSDDLNLQSVAVHKILDAHFPASIHEEIIRYFDLVLDEPHARDSATNKAFRESVLEAYGNSCALTGFSLIFNGDYVGVEATHICWPQVGGNEDVCNGIAMSTLHRKLFHLGLFAIDENFKIRVSTEAIENQESKVALRQYQSKRITLPQASRQWPSKEALKWHSRWVFRG